MRAPCNNTPKGFACFSVFATSVEREGRSSELGGNCNETPPAGLPGC